MIPTEQQREDFKKAAEPLMKYLAENHHPHMEAIVSGGRAELLESKCVHNTDKFIL